jgi:hypothetical protein
MQKVNLHTKSAGSFSTAAEAGSISYPSTSYKFHVKKCILSECGGGG